MLRIALSQSHCSGSEGGGLYCKCVQLILSISQNKLQDANVVIDRDCNKILHRILINQCYGNYSLVGLILVIV